MFVCATKAERAAILCFALGCVSESAVPGSAAGCDMWGRQHPWWQSMMGAGGKMQTRKKFHPTEQSLFKVRTLKCYLNEIKWQKLVLAELGPVTPRQVPGECSWSRRESGWRCRGRAVRLPGAHREAPAIRGTAGTPGALRLQEQEETKTKPTVSCSALFYGTALQR